MIDQLFHVSLYGNKLSKHILITGGNGFIGSNLIRELQENFFEVKISVIDNEIKCPKGNLKNIFYLKGDIRKSEDLNYFKDVDIIVHLAADTRVIDSINDPINNFDVNCFGTLNLLKFALKDKVKKIIFASTGGAIIGEQIPPVTEDTFPRPISPYGASKLACESYIHAFSKSYGLKYCSLRFTNVYGPNSFHKESVVAHFIKKILNKEEITVYGNGNQTRDYIFVNDIAKIIIRSFEDSYEGVYQLGSGVGTKLIDLIKHIEEANKQKASIIFKDKRAGELDDTWADISKSKRAKLINDLTEIEEGIKITYDWFKKQLNQHEI